MGTSKSFGGQGNNTPLVPKWLDEEIPDIPVGSDFPFPQKEEGVDPNISPNLPPIAPQTPLPQRFKVARTNFTRYSGSGGTDSSSLRRAISHYISESTGGASNAARRMGPSRKSGKLLLGFLSNTISSGVQEALKELNLESLVNLPITEIFWGMAEYVCPDGGSIEEGIARDAFFETIADLAKNNISDLNALNIEQMGIVLELYMTHTIVDRIYNDIGTKAIQIPSEPRKAIQIQNQVEDFVRRGVSDALSSHFESFKTLNTASTSKLIDRIYVDTFQILQKLGNAEEANL